MLRHPKHDLDNIDLMIIEELAKDGRIPIARLATKIGINQRTASSRLQRIISDKIIKVVAISTVSFSQNSLRVSMGFTVKPELDIHEVAEKLASYSNFCSITLTTGPYDLMSWAFFDDLEALSAFLRYEIVKISGITSNEILIHLETVKSVLTYPICNASSYKYEPAAPKRDVKKRYIPDNLDMSIIEELQKDGRITVVELAKKLGISRVSATKRLQRLFSEGITEVIAVTLPGSLGYEVTAMIGVKVFPGTVDEVANKVASFDSVHFVAITVGRYDVILGVHFSEIQKFSDFIRVDLGKISDIAKTENIMYVEIFRSPWDSVPIPRE